jgi:hypothetical protein
VEHRPTPGLHDQRLDVDVPPVQSRELRWEIAHVAGLNAVRIDVQPVAFRRKYGRRSEAWRGDTVTK